MAFEKKHGFKTKEVFLRRTIKLNDPDDEKLLLNALLHACDIGNPTMEYTHYLKWASLIV